MSQFILISGTLVEVSDLGLRVVAGVEASEFLRSCARRLGVDLATAWTVEPAAGGCFDDYVMASQREHSGGGALDQTPLGRLIDRLARAGACVTLWYGGDLEELPRFESSAKFEAEIEQALRSPPFEIYGVLEAD